MPKNGRRKMLTSRKIRILLRKFCSVDLKKFFPIIQWLPLYRFSTLRCDIIAGIAVSLLLITDQLVHAVIAGLQPQYGLYTSFPSMFIYVFIGTCKDINMAGTTITALLTNRYSITEEVRPEIASSIAFLVGIVLIFVAIFRIGFIVRFISVPVVSGFMSASGVVLIVVELSFLFGLSRPPRLIYMKLKYFVENLEHARSTDTVLGICCFIIVLLLQWTASLKVPENASKQRRVFLGVVIAIGVGRNALIQLLSILIAYVAFIIKGENPFITVGTIPSGLPDFKMPLRPVKINANQTMEVTELIRGFGSGLAIFPLIIILQEIAVAKSLARKNDYKIDAFQEIIATGLANVFVSFFSGFPVTGSIGRTIVNSMSGAKTCFSGVVASVIAILAIQFFGPLFSFLPLSCPAALWIVAGAELFDYKLVMKLWRVNKPDLVVWTVTFWGCLYEFEIGILSGMGLSITFMIWREFNPRLDIKIDKEAKTVTVSLKGGVWYPGIEAVADKVAGVLEKEKNCIDVVVIDCKNMLEIDYTVIHGLNEIIADCMLVNVQVRFVNVSGTKIRKHLDDAGFLKSNPVLTDDENQELMENGDIPLERNVEDKGDTGAEIELISNGELVNDMKANVFFI